MAEFSSPAIASGPGQRIASIDVLRALTMVLMVFINDIVTLKNIPGWLDHVERGVDGMHVADVVYPAFLFIVGLSLYFAINQRRNKGESDWQQVKHIFIRAATLLLFGAFLINPFTINEQSAGIKNFLWDPLCVICFILIFNTYPKVTNKKTVTILKTTGAVLLIAMVFIYQLGWRTNRESIDLNHFVPQHWGILGGIGWAYLVSALIMLFSRNKFWPIFIGWAFFCFVSMASKAHIIPRGAPFSFLSGSITGGTLVGLTMGGVLTSCIFQYYRDKKDNIRLTLMLTVVAIVLACLSVITRPYWKLAKLGATPAWLFLCSAITIVAFLLVYWIADVYKKAKWFDVVKPAGTDTILVYFIPYVLYAIMRITNFVMPEALLTGGLGLLKSFLFALLCVWIVRTLNRAGIRLKL